MGDRLFVSTGHCLRSFRELCWPVLLPAPWCRRRRLAIESYWSAHPIRADRLTRALAARSQAPSGWIWRLGDRRSGLPFTFRTPPAPYREAAHAMGPGFCCVCGQPVYRLGWHVGLWGSGPNKNAVWHSACVVAWQFWNAPSIQIRLLRRLQGSRCAQSAGRLWRNAEVDHGAPLFSGLERAPGLSMAEAARFLGNAEPSGHQKADRLKGVKGVGP